MSMSVDSFRYYVCLAIDIIHEMGGQCSFYLQNRRLPINTRFLKDFETNKQVVFDTTTLFEEEIL